MRKNINEQGRSMIEMLGVLAIVGVLTVGAIQGYSSAMERVKKSKALEEVSFITSEMRTRALTYGSYKAIFEEDLTSDNIIKSALKTKAISNPWMGGYGVYANESAIEDTPVGGMFAVVMTGLPPDCAGLAEDPFNGSIDKTGKVPNSRGYCITSKDFDGNQIGGLSTADGGTTFVVLFK